MTGDPVAVLILLGGFALLVAIRVPVALALVLASTGSALWIGLPIAVVGQQMVQGVSIFQLLAIPFFILAGELMNAGGISRRLIQLASLFIGWVRGGLAMLNVLTSTFFGGISGSAVADVSSVGSVLLPMMKKAGYDKGFSTGVTVASAAQGILIPPSHNMIIYSVAAGGVSIGGLFAAGVLPGLLLGLTLLITTYILSQTRNYPKGDPIERKEIPRILWESSLGLLTPIIIIGGIFSGIFTATESAAVACVWAFFVTFFIYKEISLKEFGLVLKNSMRTLAPIFFLIAAAGAFAHILTVLRIPGDLTAFLTGLSDNPIVILIIINIMLLVLGTIMDMAPLILITTPILLPVAVDAGLDPIHFGVIMMLNLSIGLITPPVGTVLFTGAAIAKISIEEATRGLVPFYVALIIGLILITYIPQISMLLPSIFEYV